MGIVNDMHAVWELSDTYTGGALYYELTQVVTEEIINSNISNIPMDDCIVHTRTYMKSHCTIIRLPETGCTFLEGDW